MKTRRTALALITATAAVLSTLGAGAAATPATAAAAAAPTCLAEVVGLTAGNKFVSRRMENGTVVRQKLTATAVPFRAKQMGFLEQATIKGGVRTSFIAIATDGRPRVLTVKDVNASRSLAQSSKRMTTSGFAPRLFTKSIGPHAFALDDLNRLQRLVTYRDSDGNYFFGSARVALKGMGSLRTLSFYNRQKIAGVNTDVLYATTRTGALKQIRVPVRRPGNARVVTIKRTGFASFSELSLGACNHDLNTAFIIGVDPGHNLARSYVLRDQAHPSASNLTANGRVAPSYSWKLHAVL